MYSKIASLVLAAALAAGVGACSEKAKSAPATAPGWCDLPESCKKIVQACMPKDDGTPGAVHDCHVTGMEKGIQAECDKDVANCVTTCSAAPSLSSGPPDDLFALCRDGGHEGGAEVTFPDAVLSTFKSSAGDLEIELRTAPDQPVHVGPDGEGQLRITDASTGAPVDGLTIAVTPWMPIMNHACSPVAVTVEPKGQGIYVLSPLLASMKGSCELKLTFSGSKSETAVSPAFDVTQ